MFDINKPLINESDIKQNIGDVGGGKPHNVLDDKNKGDESLAGLEESKGGVNLYSVFAIIILVLFIAMSVVLYLTKLSKNSVLANKQEEHGRLEQQLNSKELKEVSDQYQALNNGLKQVKEKINKRVSFKTLLESLTSLIPDGIVFTNIGIDEELVITVDGESDSDDSVALFIAALDQSDQFFNTNLSSLTHPTTDTSQGETSSSEGTSKEEAITFSIEVGGKEEEEK